VESLILSGSAFTIAALTPSPFRNDLLDALGVKPQGFWDFLPNCAPICNSLADN
jgi:hypothetical protein